jgi:hypothetical protein
MEEDKINNKIKKNNEKQQNKAATIIFGTIGVICIAFAIWIMISSSQSNFDYKGIKVEITKEIAPYKVSLPVYKNTITGGAVIDNSKENYFYLRNDPRKIENISFSGQINLKKDMVVNMTGDLMCSGQGILGITNLARLYSAMKVNVVKDQNATCDTEGRYMFLQIEKGNETKIEQNGPACYRIEVNNCEILKATEKFMLESVVQFSNDLKNSSKI